MLARIKVSDNIWIETDSDSEAELFKSVARVQEIFQHETCGRCGNKNVKFVCRPDKDENEWLEIVCQDFAKCGAKLVFSQKKGKGGIIYHKNRWDKLSATQQKERADEKEYAESHNGFLPNNGWFVYKRKD